MSACPAGGPHFIIAAEGEGHYVCQKCDAYWIPMSADLIAQEIAPGVDSR